jgi:ribosome-associated protein
MRSVDATHARRPAMTRKTTTSPGLGATGSGATARAARLRRPLRRPATDPVPESEVEFSAIRAQGPGGQHVNKASTAVHLRFDIGASSLPEPVKQRLLGSRDARISAQGVMVIKAQGSRSLEANKAQALQRLHEAIAAAAHEERPRKPTRPTWGSVQRRLQGKAQRASVKAGRGRLLP